MFDKPQVQNEIEAYLLGFIYADGSVLHKTKHLNKYNTVRLKISKKDKEDLIRFNKYLNWKYGETKTYIKNKKYDMVYVTNYTINMANQMITLGVIPRKTYSNEDFVFTNIPDKFKRHFIRGYFDGNGHININKKEQMIFELCSNNIVFLNTLLEYLKKYITTKSKVTSGKGVYRIRLGGNKICLQLFHLMYDNHNLDLHLNRKYEIFKKIEQYNLPKQEYKGEDLK